MRDQFEDDYFSNDNATFGDRVVAAREALGLNQQELAKKLGVKLKTVRGWENDLSEPRANKLQMMAGMMNVSIMWLLTGEGDGLDGGEISADWAGLIADLRRTKQDLTRMTEHVGDLEARLMKLAEQAL